MEGIQQWEYLTVVVDSDGYVPESDWTLNSLGQEGWELVTVGLAYADYGMYGTAFFKRPLLSSEKETENS